MNLGQLGVFCFTAGMDTRQIAELLTKVEDSGYSALWYPESRSGDESFALAGFMLARTEALIIGAGIANIYARDAVATRQGQHTLNRLSGGRFLLGLGVTNAMTVEQTRGHVFGNPIAATRAYLDGIESAADQAVPLEVSTPIVLAALGPDMTRLAGQRTAGAFPYNMTPEHTAWARNIVGPDPWIIAEQKVMLETDPGTARRVARECLSRYMDLPHFRNGWLRLGFTEDELAGAGSDRFIDAIVAWGDETALRERIQAHIDAGANHVCIQALHPDGLFTPNLRTIEALAP